MFSLSLKEFFQKPFFILAQEGQRGQVLFITALVISATVIAIALALSTTISGELRISADVGYYIPAFYAADAGAEKDLYCQRNGLTCVQTSATLGNGALYSLDNPGANSCPSSAKFCSTGTFNGTSRKIQVSY